MTDCYFACADEQTKQATDQEAAKMASVSSDPAQGTKKRGRLIASIAVSFAVPFTSGFRGIIARTSFASVPFDPDVKAVFPLVQRSFSHLRPEDMECDERRENHALERVEYPTGLRAVAQHLITSDFVEEFQTRDKCERRSGSELSNPSASYRPVCSILSHVCLTDITWFVTGLRQIRGFTFLDPRPSEQ